VQSSATAAVGNPMPQQHMESWITVFTSMFQKPESEPWMEQFGQYLNEEEEHGPHEMYHSHLASRMVSQPIRGFGTSEH